MVLAEGLASLAPLAGRTVVAAAIIDAWGAAKRDSAQTDPAATCPPGRSPHCSCSLWRSRNGGQSWIVVRVMVRADPQKISCSC